MTLHLVGLVTAGAAAAAAGIAVFGAEGAAAAAGGDGVRVFDLETAAHHIFHVVHGGAA